MLHQAPGTVRCVTNVLQITARSQSARGDMYVYVFVIASSEKVWLAVVVGTLVWSVVLWLLLKVKQNDWVKDQLSLASSLFYGWGLLLEDHPYDPPISIAGQVGDRIKECSNIQKISC